MIEWEEPAPSPNSKHPAAVGSTEFGGTEFGGSVG